MSRKNLYLIIVMAIFFLFTSCISSWQQVIGVNVRQGVSSSLVDYLYPKGEIPPEYDRSVPNLNLPLRVGLAFVPSSSGNVEGLSETHKAELLEKAGQAFSGREFIKEIVKYNL